METDQDLAVATGLNGHSKAKLFAKKLLARQDPETKMMRMSHRPSISSPLRAGVTT
ncbi:hypothetical protein DOTSEDRAFT_25360 [Dothistroma septosporum NZE10]|uniref:Uncharacterized protein n=1 Tax=Dothistroma septosporum (strain NZE10 / CBS 128990) TaxID=675120 RepID=M2XLV9_DOTSN|nr:hypothetical protein DOTSEDRAFT_25360 [Dothistroma septosporum NZE10]